jgi:hypothetical protein
VMPAARNSAFRASTRSRVVLIQPFDAAPVSPSAPGSRAGGDSANAA